MRCDPSRISVIPAAGIQPTSHLQERLPAPLLSGEAALQPAANQASFAEGLEDAQAWVISDPHPVPIPGGGLLPAAPSLPQKREPGWAPLLIPAKGSRISCQQSLSPLGHTDHVALNEMLFI